MDSHQPVLRARFAIPMVLALGGILIVVLLLVQFVSVSANSGDLSNAEAQYPAMVGSRIDSCSLCHVPGMAPSLNPFGAAYKANGRNRAALVTIESQDSDGDGISNIQEINALTFPGDPNDPMRATATATATTRPSATATPTAQSSATVTKTGAPSATTPPTYTKTANPYPPPVTATTVATQATATRQPTLIGTQRITRTLTKVKTARPSPTRVCSDHEDDKSSSKDRAGGKGGSDDCTPQTLTARATRTLRVTRTPMPTRVCTDGESDRSQRRGGGEDECDTSMNSQPSASLLVHELVGGFLNLFRRNG